MRLLGALPAANSPRFALNSLDWSKILRFLLVQLIVAAPVAFGIHYVWRGVDYTPQMYTVLGGTAVEMLRRFFSGPAEGPPSYSQGD